jgi:hypothetical protein
MLSKRPRPWGEVTGRITGDRFSRRTELPRRRPSWLRLLIVGSIVAIIQFYISQGDDWFWQTADDGAGTKLMMTLFFTSNAALFSMIGLYISQYRRGVR